jgi:hypothetical protein
VTEVLVIDGAQKRFGATLALDGYRNVFHVNAPVYELWPQVLAGMTAVFLVVARLSARR